MPRMSNSTRLPPNNFSRAVVFRDDEQTPTAVVPGSSNSFCSNYHCFDLASRLEKVEDELKITKDESLAAKRNACIRQTALDVERALKKILLQGLLPAEELWKCYDRRGRWIDEELDEVVLISLWTTAPNHIQRELVALCGQNSTLDGVDGVLDDLCTMKQTYSFTAYPKTLPDGKPYTLSARLELIEGLTLPHRELLEELIKNLLRDC